MSTGCYIKMNHVNMRYPSNIYNATTLKQVIFERLRFQKPKPLLKDVLALKDFSLDVREGERIGIIGRNGSGKSTLLKTIAGIYPVDTGEVEVCGKIRALFEISLGFDFESTGRENILYRSLLLGATPTEARDKTQEIIDFAGLGEFIDYPVKTYSSGMLVRLAFSVSTSINGEILLLDEVIGAGDAGFIDKARRRIFDLMDQSSLMVLVSHDMNTVNSVCTRVIWMQSGEIIADGKPDVITEQYVEAMRA